MTISLRILALAALLAVSSCKKDEAPPAAPPASPKAAAATPPKQPPAPAMPAEVELSGTLTAKTKAPRYLIYVSKDPCSAAKEVTPYGSTNLTAEGGFFLEIFVPQGTVASLCAVALDAGGNVTAVASYEKNPLTLKGEGEILVKDATLALEDLQAPVAAPKGLPR